MGAHVAIIEPQPPPPPRCLRNALYWAVLASLVASLALPAVAVTHSAPSDIPGTVLFSGSLRVGEVSGFSDVQAGFDLVSGRGSLSPPSFTVDDATFEFSVIDVFSSNFAAYAPYLQVRFRADADSDAALAGSLLALHLGPETFTFRFDDRDSAGGINFENPGLSWADDDTVDVRLALLSAPAAPAGLTATARGRDTIDLAWNVADSDGGRAISGYRIEVSSDGAAPWSVLAEAEADATSYSDTGLSPGSTRHYRVSAINSVGTSDPSNIAFATTAAATAQAEVWSATLSVQDLGSGMLGCDSASADPGGRCSNSSVLSNEGFDLGGTDFAISLIRLRSDGTLELAFDEALASGAESLTLEVDGTAFAFEGAEVQTATRRHWKGSGLAWSAGSTVELRLTSLVSIPEAPAGLSAAAAGSSQIDLFWTAPASDGGAPVSGYRIEVSSDAGSGWEDLVADTEDTFTNYRHTGLPPGAERHYRVSAINAAGASGPSRTASATSSLTVEVEVWSGTLAVQDLGSSLLGCDNLAGGGACSDSTVLSDDDFTLGGTDFAVAGLWLGPEGTLELALDTGLNAEAESLTLRTGGISFLFENADVHGTASRLWQNPGFGWTLGETVDLQLTVTAPAVPGRVLFAGTLTAGTGGAGYSKASGLGSLVPDSFEYESHSFSLGAIEFSGNSLLARLERTGGSGDDPLAGSLLALHLGTDVFTFRYDERSAGGWIDFTDHGLAWSDGESVDVRLALLSPPGPPTGLRASSYRQDTIDLAWQAPASDGGTPVTGYRIEVSEDSGANWSELVADTESTGTTHSHPGLSPRTRRHYRVSAINAAGTSEPSRTDSATTIAGDYHAVAPVIPGTLLYSGTLAAEVRSDASLATAGFDLALQSVVADPIGSLSPAGFTHGGQLFGFRSIEFTRDLGFGIQTDRFLVAFGRDSVAGTDPLAGSLLALHLGPVTLTFRYDDRVGGAIELAREDPGWSDGDRIEVRLALLSPPAAPSGLTATADGRDTIDLAWQVPASDGGTAITGYRIEVSPDGNSPWSLLGEAATTSYSDTGLPAGTTRHYRVSANNAAGASDPSNTAFATTDPPVAPDAPTDLRATAIGSTRIELAWTAPASDGGAAISGYRIEVSEDSGLSWSVLVDDTASDETAYSHDRLDARSMRHYRVSAISAAGASAPSNTASATTDAAHHAAPAAIPGTLLYSATLTSATVPYAGQAHTGYDNLVNSSASLPLGSLAPGAFIYSGQAYEFGFIAFAGGDLLVNLSRDAFADNPLAGSLLALHLGPATFSYRFGDLETGQLALFSPHGLAWVAGDTADVRLALLSVPGAPAGLTATARGTDMIDLAWGAPASDGGTAVSGYRIEVSPDAGANWSVLVDDTASADTAYSHSGLSAGDTRHYRVSAVNAAGSSDASNTASATTDTVPDAPTGLTATAGGSTRIDLAWSAPASDGGAAVSGYRIEVSEDAGANWSVLVDDTASEATAWSHTGLPAETERHYRVSAINSAGTSDPSETAFASTSSETVDAEVWSGTLTVQDLGTSVLGCDNVATAGKCSDAAVLSDDDFTLGDTDFAIAKVRLTGGALLLNLDTGLTAAAGSLTLHVGGTAFSFEGADVEGGFGRQWNSSGLVWTAGDTVALQLTVPIAAPEAPTGLAAAASGGSQIDLAWTAPEDEGGSAIAGYRIEVSYDAGSSWDDLVADTGDAFTNYRHTGIPPGAERHYRVSAINAAGLSDPSGTASAATTSQTVEAEVWSGTLTVQDVGSGLLGCDSTAAVGACSDASVLSEDEFSLGGTDFALAGIRLGADGTLELSLDTGLNTEAESLTLRAGGINFAFGNADVKGTDSRLWQNSGFGWAAGDTVALQLTATAEEVPGTLLFSGTLVVGIDTVRAGRWTGYNEAEGQGTLTPGSFLHEGHSFSLGAIEVSGNALAVALGRTGGIGSDPLAGRVLALHLGTKVFLRRYDDFDRIGFVIINFHRLAWSDGESVDVRLALLAPPAPPTGLTATTQGRNAIDLEWEAPARDGGTALTGYRIEVSEDGGETWTDLVRDTGDTATAYSHTGLPVGSLRHYRVSAINAAGPSDPSGTDFATTVGGTHHAVPATIPGSTPLYAATLLAGTVSDPLDTWTGYGLFGSQGSLSPSDEFTHDGEGFFWVSIRYTGDRLLVRLRRTERYVDSTNYALAGRVLALQLGPRTFVFGYDDRTQDGTINFYGHGLAWTVGDTVDVRLAALNPPAAPAGLTAAADGNTRIDLQWQAPASDGGSALTGYRIEVSEDGGSRWSSLVANLAADPASDTVTYSHTGLAAAITRHYRVSPSTPPASPTPPAPPSPPPTAPTTPPPDPSPGPSFSQPPSRRGPAPTRTAPGPATTARRDPAPSSPPPSPTPATASPSPPSSSPARSCASPSREPTAAAPTRSPAAVSPCTSAPRPSPSNTTSAAATARSHSPRTTSPGPTATGSTSASPCSPLPTPPPAWKPRPAALTSSTWPGRPPPATAAPPSPATGSRSRITRAGRGPTSWPTPNPPTPPSPIPASPPAAGGTTASPPSTTTASPTPPTPPSPPPPGSPPQLPPLRPA